MLNYIAWKKLWHVQDKWEDGGGVNAGIIFGENMVMVQNF